MASDEKTIRRTLHFKFTMPGASEQMIAMIKSATPLYQMFGDAKVRLLQNVDDPGRFLQEIEYDAPESLETNRQQIASDPRVQAYMHGLEGDVSRRHRDRRLSGPLRRADARQAPSLTRAGSLSI